MYSSLVVGLHGLMTSFVLGIQYGIFLSVLVGPLVFALVDAGVQKGVRAGIFVGLGIWISDVLFVLSVYAFFSEWRSLVQYPYFTQIVGAAGTVVLMGTGILSFGKNQSSVIPEDIRARTYASLLAKGFILNTANPFTVFFWMFMMTSEVLPKGYTGDDSFLFFTGILATIVCTDTLKVLLSKKIRSRLDPNTLARIHTFSGCAMILFGVLLFVRSFWGHQGPILGM